MPFTADSISLAKAGPGDVETLVQITRAAYEKYVARLGRQPRPMTADYAALVLEQSVWLLRLDERVAGLLVLVAEADAMLIYSVAVHPDFQKRGLGRRLLALAEEQARAAGYARIRLYTNERMVENTALYRRLGYRETGREAVGATALVHMAKNLEP